MRLGVFTKISADETQLKHLTVEYFSIESYNWNGILAPARTPPAIVARIQAIIAAGLIEGGETFTRQGQDPGGDSPAQFVDFLRSEQERFVKIAKAANIPRQNYGSVR